MWYFQILIVSAVKICKQCLQTASVSEGRLPDPLPGLRPWTTQGDVLQTLWAITPQMKIPGAYTGWNYNTCSGLAAEYWTVIDVARVQLSPGPRTGTASNLELTYCVLRPTQPPTLSYLHLCASVTKQYNLVLAKQRLHSAVGKVTSIFWRHTSHLSQT